MVKRIEHNFILFVLIGMALSTLPLTSAELRAVDHAAPHQSDAWFADYKLCDGETISRLRIHYAALGSAHRNNQREIDNAILLLHWTGADGRELLNPSYRKALFDEGRPLDFGRFYLTIPGKVGHGQSSKPSDGLKTGFPNYGYNDIVDLQHKLITAKIDGWAINDKWGIISTGVLASSICTRFSACRWAA
jgi:homoserine acetyltransferase